MSGDEKYTRWTVSPRDLQGMSEERARDLIVRCFIEAQKETFQHARERLGASTDEGSIQKTMMTSVRMAFTEVGGDFDHPTPDSLQKVVEKLGRAAMSWGTPTEIIQHHQMQIQRVLERLGEAKRPS